MLLLLIIAVSGILTAAQVSEDVARVVAENMLLERGRSNEIEWNETYTIGESQTDLYIFNHADGFIIVSADDRAIPVLAYSFEGSYDAANIPPQFNDWINEWQFQLEQIRENSYPAGERAISDWQRLSSDNFTPVRNLRDVSPLLSCNWNQDSPWNAHCPYGPGQNNPFVYAGCVATSMAQVMYYWEHPAVGEGSHSYNHDSYGNISCDFSATEFNYDSMNDYSATYEAKELQWACGVAVEMDYDPNGSGAQIGYGTYSARNSMVNFFDYSPEAVFRSKDSYSTDTYESLIREDLDNGRPLLFGGVDGNMGHAFNLDGYQGTSYFHFNFGWSGYANGYYYLSNLNPMGYAFNSDQGGVFSLYPEEDLSAPYDVTAVLINDDDVIISWDHNELNRSLRGFNIYQNGALEETADPDETSIQINNLAQGTYLFWITAVFATGESEMSDMVTVDVVPPTAPIADAGEDIITSSGSEVILDGSGSFDPNGDDVTYSWTAPADITLDDPTAMTPVFIAPEVSEETEYAFSLIVSDGSFFSDPDEVIVTVMMADASDDQILAGNIRNLKNYPNPFNPETTISFNLQEDSDLSITIYNIKGTAVKEIHNGRVPAGNHNYIWNGIDQENNAAASGIYYYKIQTENSSASGKMILMK